MNAEKTRLENDRNSPLPWSEWKQWGPYLAERQWGTVREDYSASGDAWRHVTHEQSRSTAYRWGEDGIAGFCDDEQWLCFSVALWNGKDKILKERLFGLTGPEGNHGEDVKECYYYLDALPTNAYMKMLYKYPQCEFPYRQLLEKNAAADRHSPEFELHDTGCFEDNKYFDVHVEYAKASPQDFLIKITATNVGPEASELHVLPHLWFRNTWSWGRKSFDKPMIRANNTGQVMVTHPVLGEFEFHCQPTEAGAPKMLFCENETNANKLHGDRRANGFFKDAIHDFVIEKKTDAVNPEQVGTKCAAWYSDKIEPGASIEFRLRLRSAAVSESDPFADFDQVFDARLNETNEFYEEIQAEVTDEDARLIQRQAYAGLIWTKQFYNYEVGEWLDGDPAYPKPPAERRDGRNSEWLHLNNADVISMPDKWEYPWYAAWDLAFHCLPLAVLDADFAKEQLVLMTREWYMHPNGQIPAYEWEFGDVNPPVHAWATWRVYQIDREQNGKPDRFFLERVFHKLLLNFTWWVNRKDTDNRNVFQGGFLGLDNIGVFDRSKPIAGGGHLDQADGTSWMAMYSLNMLRISIELALENPVYEDIATKFFEHFLHIALAMNNIGGSGIGLWDEQDEFYYDVLHMPNGDVKPLKIRSLVGLTPLFAVETLEPETLLRLPEFAKRLDWVMKNRPQLASLVSRWHEPGRGERRLLSLLRGHRMKSLLRRMLDETEFLSDFGVRALSKAHEKNPFTFQSGSEPLTVGYQPAESTSAMFGGNSNWRGPIWFPMNFLLIESLQKFHHYYGDDFLIECPVGSKKMITLKEASEEIARRLTKIFLKNAAGVRPVFGHQPQMQNDPRFSDNILFYEYFHGDTGRGVGASHQTGWTALVAELLQTSSKPL